MHVFFLLLYIVLMYRPIYHLCAIWLIICGHLSLHSGHCNHFLYDIKKLNYNLP